MMSKRDREQLAALRRKRSTFNMRLTNEEKARFEEVARAFDLTLSAMVRFLMKREADRLESAARKR